MFFNIIFQDYFAKILENNLETVATPTQAITERTNEVQSPTKWKDPPPELRRPTRLKKAYVLFDGSLFGKPECTIKRY